MSQRDVPSQRSIWPVTAWRLIFAGVAWWAWIWGMSRNATEWVWTGMYYFSQFSTLLVALTATGSLLVPLWSGGRLERGRGVLRGATTTYATITLVVFATLLHGSYRNLDSQLLHIAVPVLALVDWIFVGRNQERIRWYVPLLWLAVPLLYLPFYVHRSNETRPLYGFLDPQRDDFSTWVVVLLAAFLLTGWALLVVGQVPAIIRERSTRRQLTTQSTMTMTPMASARRPVSRSAPTRER